MLFEDVGVLLHPVVATKEHNAQLGERFLNVVVGHLAVNLRAEAAEELLFFLGNTELVVRAANFFGNILPATRRFLNRAGVKGDRIVIDVAQAWHPRRQILLKEEVEAAMPERAHPVRLALHVAHVIDDFVRRTLWNLVKGLNVVVEAFLISSRQNLIRQGCAHRLAFRRNSRRFRVLDNPIVAVLFEMRGQV